MIATFSNWWTPHQGRLRFDPVHFRYSMSDSFDHIGIEFTHWKKTSLSESCFSTIPLSMSDIFYQLMANENRSILNFVWTKLVPSEGASRINHAIRLTGMGLPLLCWHWQRSIGNAKQTFVFPQSEKKCLSSMKNEQQWSASLRLLQKCHRELCQLPLAHSWVYDSRSACKALRHHIAPLPSCSQPTPW